MKTTTILFAACLFLALGASSSRGDVLRLSPSQAAVVASSGDGTTRVALQFDLSGLRSGTGRKIVWAYLEWTITNNGAGEKAFAALPITSSWTASQVSSRAGSLVYSETPISEWELTQDEQDRLGCLVHLNAKDLVSDWASGLIANNGLLVTTREISGNTLTGQLENAQLVVGYGFYGQ
jgi:hypothetical protein